MLILSRKKNERIVINENIILTIVAIRGDKVRLGIEAPESVPVHRQEVFEAIQKVLEVEAHEDAKKALKGVNSND